MLRKKLCVALIAFLLLQAVQGKKTRKSKRPKPEEEIYTPQPSVVSYSTFGFNDVGTYEGFVPSSPDYTKFLTGANEESTTKEHSPVFPTSSSNDFPNSYNDQPYSGQSFSMFDDGRLQTASVIQYPQNPIGAFHPYDSSNDQNRNAALDDIYGRNVEDVNAPTYGTKLNSRNRLRPSHYNNTDFSGPSDIQNDDKFTSFQDSKPVFENRPFNQGSSSFETKPTFSESTNTFFGTPSFPSTNMNEFNKPISSETPNSVKFQRVVDFTKLKQNQPLELDTSRLPTATPIPDVFENNESMRNNFFNTYDVTNNSQKQLFTPTKQKDMFKPNYNNEDTFDKNAFKANSFKGDPYHFSGYESGKDNLIITQSDIEAKKKTRIKPWSPGGHLIKKWKEPSPSKGYEYSTNYSSMSFSYDSDKEKITKPLGSSIDELTPASSNIDLPNYQFPNTDFSNFKKMPEYKVHEEDEYANFPSYKDLSNKPNEIDYDHYKNLYSTTPTTTAYWGNAFKSSEYTSSKRHPSNYSKFKYGSTRDNEEIVNIPRRPNRYNYEKPYESNQNEWSHPSRRPQRNRPYKDWNSDTPTTRFKSEEDLLGLRNQDTSHPSYLPSYQSSNFVSEEIDYKKLVDQWRQSYLKSKFKDSLRDYESFGTETKPKHVPVPKPYPIEVPHPVIVPVPQPYPVRVPIAKPVAVPVIREIKIPIEKPMPYLVYKDVPYPIEKPVPVPVEKEVPVPVVKPYPVHVPYIRPVFHHTKSRDEYDDHRDDDDYMPRPEGKNKYMPFKKKTPNGSRNRWRRPSRNSYQERNRRLWPERHERRRPSDKRNDLPRMRPIELHHPSPFKRRDSENMQFEEPNFFL